MCTKMTKMGIKVDKISKELNNVWGDDTQCTTEIAISKATVNA